MESQKAFCIMCGDELEPGALFCSSCGAKQETIPQIHSKHSEQQIEASPQGMIQNNPIPNVVTGEQQFCCPQCHSDNIQRYEIIYNQNVSSSSHTTTGVGTTFGGNFGAGVATTTGTSVTALGETVAPPSPKPTAFITLKAGCLFLLFGGLIIAIVVTIIASITSSNTLGELITTALIIGLIVYRYKVIQDNKRWNREIYPQLVNEWQHSYMCMKCGHRFVL